MKPRIVMSDALRMAIVTVTLRIPEDGGSWPSTLEPMAVSRDVESGWSRECTSAGAFVGSGNGSFTEQSQRGLRLAK
jgi:hypothetical protein